MTLNIFTIPVSHLCVFLVKNVWILYILFELGYFVLFAIESYEFLVYFIYQLFVRYMIWKYFLPLHWSPSHFVYGLWFPLQHRDYVALYSLICLFSFVAFVYKSNPKKKNHCLDQYQGIYLLVFSYRVLLFQVLHIRFFNPFWSWFLCDVR